MAETAAAWVVAVLAAAVATALAAGMFREASVAAVAVAGAAAPLAVAVLLAAAAPGPVARVVLPAWEAVASVVVAEVAAVAASVAAGEAAAVVADAAAVVVEGRRGAEEILEAKQMKTKLNNSFATRILWRAGAFALGCSLACVLGSVAYAAAQSTAKAATKGMTPTVKQKKFATSKEAADALIKAAEEFDVPTLQEILGPQGADMVATKDTAQDKQRAATFVAKAGEKTTVTPDPKNPRRAILSVGNEDWPYPVPIVKGPGGWYFNAREGRKEILDRRIGANELDALTICRGYAEVQKEYALEAHDGVNQYAQRIISTPGKHDGLAWKNDDGSWAGPVGEGIAKALQQGYSSKTEPYHGYYFKILKGQGPDAPLGKMDFVVKGLMIGGFALVAVPADYRITGVKTFIVSYEDVVHEKDLGPDSLNIVKKMELYNPDKTWRRTDDGWQARMP